MTVTVKLFAILRERAGTAQLVVELPEHSTVAAAREALAARFPALREHLSAAAPAVNRSYVSAEMALADGDELAFIPPVSGG